MLAAPKRLLAGSALLCLLACGGGDAHLVRDIDPRLGDTVQMVVEIPAGDTAKYEVNKSTGKLEWQQKDGRPRVIDYLPYPGNYGFIPRTLSPKDKGGDGDPLDVLVLGSSRPRGEVMQVYLIGVLKLLDEGEQDDKLIAVPSGAGEASGISLNDVRTLEDLRSKWTGIDAIIEIWFSNYDGANTTQVVRWGDEREAEQIVDAAQRAFEERQ